MLLNFAGESVIASHDEHLRKGTDSADRADLGEVVQLEGRDDVRIGDVVPP